MVGHNLRVEPITIVLLKKNVEIWQIFERGENTPFFKAMKEKDEELSSQFINSLKDYMVQVGRIKNQVTKELIS